MTPGYLIDSDWMIDHLNSIGSVVEKMAEFRAAGLGVSIVSVSELYEGVIYSRDSEKSQQAFSELLSGMTILGIDEGVARIFGRERGKLRRSGQLIGDFDLLIAATALYYHIPLCTNNRRHFERIEELTLISITT